MKNTFGNSLTVTLFGESHGNAIGAVVDGIAPGIKIDEEYIKKALQRRRPSGEISTRRKEEDEYEFLSGVFEGYTTGAPLCVSIKNSDTKSSDYSKLKSCPRPSHADYTAELKYGGYQDYRGGGHFSGRLTAPLVLVGAILSSALLKKGIRIGTHISEMHGAYDRLFDGDILSDIELLSLRTFPTLTESAEKSMKEEILKAKEKGDSVGGILESAVIGLPAGVGEPWFDSAESTISHILFSIPAVKGVEFGRGFALADMYGSEANDPFKIEGEKVITLTNNSGGINGGITNGMPIILKTALRPTPSIQKPQMTVDLSKMENTTLEILGRHDPCIAHRAAPVIDAALAIAVSDMLVTRFGTNYLSEN